MGQAPRTAQRRAAARQHSRVARRAVRPGLSPRSCPEPVSTGAGGGAKQPHTSADHHGLPDGSSAGCGAGAGAGAAGAPLVGLVAPAGCAFPASAGADRCSCVRPNWVKAENSSSLANALGLSGVPGWAQPGARGGAVDESECV
jgi:hypothetical protein